MSAKDVFGLIIRTIGLVVALYGVYSIFYAAIEEFHMMPEAKYSACTHLTYGVFSMAFGVLMMGRAGWLTDAAYKK